MGADGSKAADAAAPAADAAAAKAAPDAAAAKAAPAAAAAAAAAPSAKAVDPAVQAAFKKFDTDGSGDIDVTELSSAMKELGIDVSNGEAMETLKKYAPGAKSLTLDAFSKLATDYKASQPAAKAAAAAPKAKSPKASPKAKPAADPASIAKAKGEAKPAAEAKAKAKAKEPKEPKVQGVRLCVKNLAEDMTQEQLKALFAPFGNVLKADVKLNPEGKCKGFAFVNLGNQEEADKAIKEMDKKDVSGKELSVAIAEGKKKEEGADGEKGKGKGKGKGKEKGDSKGKGEKGKGKSGKGAADTHQQAQQTAYPYSNNPYAAQYGQQYPGYPYSQQQMYAQQMQYAQNPAYAQQMQAAQLQQMQAMVQGMWMQAAQMQQHAGAGTKAAMAPGPVPPQAAGGKEFIGTLKSLSGRNGYGFIDCPETKKLYERDVYVSADLLPEGGKEAGTRLKFTVGENSKGHPQARSCSSA